MTKGQSRSTKTTLNRLGSYVKGTVANRVPGVIKSNRRKAIWVAGSAALLLAPVAYAIDNVPADTQPVEPIQSSSQVNSTSNSADLSPTDGSDNGADQNNQSSSSQTTNVTQDENGTNINVNGQDVPVPTNGSVSKTIDSNGSHTSVQISTTNNSSGNSMSFNSSNTSLNQSSNSNTFSSSSEDSQ